MISSLVLRSQSDVRLTALAAEGSEAAFEAIVQRYRRDLLAYCSRVLVSDSRAEDAVQQALLCAWSALRAGVEVRHLKSWLYRITHNQAISILRRSGSDCDELSESLSGPEAPETDLEQRMLLRETLAAVAALPSDQRQAILRTAVQGDSYTAVAASMGVSDHALRGLVYRARVTLRAAAGAIAPPPLVLWAAGLGRRHSGVLTWLSDALAGGGAGATASVGAGAVVVKSAAVLATSAALVGGGLTAQHHRADRQRQAPSRAAALGARHMSSRAEVAVTRSAPIGDAGSPVGATSGRAMTGGARRTGPAQAPAHTSDQRAGTPGRRSASLDPRSSDSPQADRRRGSSRQMPRRTGVPAGTTGESSGPLSQAPSMTGPAPATSGQPAPSGTQAGQSQAIGDDAQPPATG